MGSFSLSEPVNAVAVDDSGKYLVIAETDQVQVFATGVPEPTSAVCLLTIFPLAGMRRWRRK